MRELSDLQPVRELPSTLVLVPTFITGTLEQLFSPEYEEARQGNDSFAFRGKDSGTSKGSNVFNLGLANKVLADAGGKFRTPVPTDNVYRDIYPMIKDNFYADLNALDVWEEAPSYDRNIQIWEQVIELAKKQLKKQGESLRFPFRIQGFYCTPDSSEKGYGAKITPAGNFRVIQDDKLDFPSGTRFDSLEENGMIVPKENGKFTKYTLGNGVSRVCLDGYGDLDCDCDNLGGSYVNGRVVIVDAEGIAQKFSPDEYKRTIDEIYQFKIDKANAIRSKALSELEKL